MNRKAFFYGIFYIFFVVLTVQFKFERDLIILLGISILSYYGSLLSRFSGKITVKFLFYIVSLFLHPFHIAY